MFKRLKIALFGKNRVCDICGKLTGKGVPLRFYLSSRICEACFRRLQQEGKITEAAFPAPYITDQYDNRQ